MIDEGPGEFDQHLMDDNDPDDDASDFDDENTVQCPSCSEQVWAEADKCPHCGGWFQGQAWENKTAGGPAPRYWFWWVAACLLVIMAYLLVRTGIPI